jgi:hypothetical protein
VPSRALVQQPHRKRELLVGQERTQVQFRLQFGEAVDAGAFPEGGQSDDDFLSVDHASQQVLTVLAGIFQVNRNLHGRLDARRDLLLLLLDAKVAALLLKIGNK